MQVCKKWGHVITPYFDSSPQHRQDYCDKCGSTTVTICTFCGEKIRGKYHVDGWLIAESYSAPLNCHKCGKPYPWRKIIFAKNMGYTLISPAKYVVDSVVSIFKK
jgi:hypothetical protein